MAGVIILGAGLAGLGCARELPGARIYEANAYVGGHVFSHALAGVPFDEGAHISHAKDPTFVEMINRAAGEVVTVPRSIVRNVWQGHWISYPVQNNLRELPEDLRIAALTDLVQAQLEPAGTPANYREWCRRQYGQTLASTFYEVYTPKYWRVPSEELACDWMGGRVLPSMMGRIVEGAFRASAESQAVFSQFRYPARDGFFGFFRSLYDGLAVQCGERAVGIDWRARRVRFASGREDSYDVLASSIPLPELMRILTDIPSHLGGLAQRLRWTQLLCVNMVIRRPHLTDCHWFYIYDHHIDPCRVSVPTNFSHELAPGRTALQAEIYRRNDEAFEVEELLERTVEQMAELLSFDRADVEAVGHRLVPYAYVISDHRRSPTVETLTSWLQSQGIYCMGLHGRWKYVWSDAAFQQGQETAAAIRGLPEGMRDDDRA